jgi:hypothetical protein
VYCKNCGHENDDDSSFCENCGANLSPSNSPSGMSTANKILIVVVIVLIASIGIAAGMLLTSKAPVANNTTTNTSANVSEPVTTTTTSTNDTNYIGESKAKQIAIDFLTERGGMETISKMSVDFVTINGVPLYRVKYYDSYVTVYGTETGWEDVLIGAKDGKLYDDYGERVTT